MNNTTEFTIKILKTDNGTEYTNENFNKYLSENGIKLIHSTPGYNKMVVHNELIKLLIIVQPHYLILPNYLLIFGILLFYVHIVYITLILIKVII